MIDVPAILAEIKALNDGPISQWCMRMAWPGGCPTPPFAAWERRADLIAQLRAAGFNKYGREIRNEN